MKRQGASGRLVIGLCMAVVITPIAANGLAQPSGFPGLPPGVTPYNAKPDTKTSRQSKAFDNKDQETVTTVEPLVVSPMVPVPNVGRGATYFTIPELAAVAQQAREDHIEARSGSTLCRMSAGNLGSQSGGTDQVLREDAGSFSLQSLLMTQADAEWALQQAAETAEAATLSAEDARKAARAGTGDQKTVDATELARQTAVRTYQTAQAAALEAELRIADLQDQVELLFDGKPPDPAAPPGSCDGIDCANNADWLRKQHPEIKVAVDNHTYERQHGDVLAGVYVPPEFKSLRLTKIVSRSAEEAGTPVIRVSGRIVNPGRASVAVPPIWVSAVDRFGTGLKSEQAEAPHGQKAIPPRDSLDFTYTMRPAPEKSARTVVTFAPLHHAPRLKPVGAYCSHLPY